MFPGTARVTIPGVSLYDGLWYSLISFALYIFYLFIYLWICLLSGLWWDALFVADKSGLGVFSCIVSCVLRKIEIYC